MAYCKVDDVNTLKGDLTLPQATEIDNFIERASSDIDAALSERYQVPITITNETTVSILKAITSSLACGRMVLAIAIASEDTSTQAYGRALIRRAIEGEGQAIGLRELREGRFILPGATLKSGLASANLFALRISSPKPDGVSDKSYFEYFYESFR